MKMINEHNAKNLAWTMGENQFTDISEDEFRKTYLTKILPSVANNNVKEYPGLPNGSKDWRTDSTVVGAVKD